MPMFPSASLLHSQVVARMRARELKTNVGAILLATRAEMIERGRPTNQGIQELSADIRRTLVYADPTQARETANEARKASTSEWAKITGNADLLKSIADRLDAEAKINEDRAVGKDPATVKRQIAFSVDFTQFKNKWDDYYIDVVKNPDVKLEGQNGSDSSDTIDLYDKGYRDYIKGYANLGFAPSTPPPVKSTAGDTVGPIFDGLGKVAISFPWEKIALFAGGALALYWFVNRRPSEPSPPALPERYVGPPEPRSEDALARSHL